MRIQFGLLSGRFRVFSTLKLNLTFITLVIVTACKCCGLSRRVTIQQKAQFTPDYYRQPISIQRYNPTAKLFLFKLKKKTNKMSLSSSLFFSAFYLADSLEHEYNRLLSSQIN